MRDVHTVAPASGPRPAQRREQMVWKACAWCGPLFVVMIVVVWMWLGRWFPPPHEDWDPPTLLRFYADNSVRIRLGMGGTVYVSIFFLLWTMAIARVMRELEGTSFPPLTILQICGGVGNFLTIILLALCWAAAGFQAAVRDADPHAVQTLHDTGWIVFDLLGAPAMVQMTCFGVVVLGQRDPGVAQLVPRWVGYLSFMVTASFLEVVLLLFFKSGPFAWDGAITYYVIMVLYFSWLISVSWYVLRAVRHPGA